MGALVKTQPDIELPATNFLVQSLNDEVRRILGKTESKLNSAVLQMSELQREDERIEVQINNMKEYVRLRSRQTEIRRQIKSLRKLVDSLGYTMNETLLQALDHVDGKTLTEKAAYMRGVK